MVVHNISLEHKEYPVALKELKRPPKNLYFAGDISVLNSDSIAVIGKRAATEEQNRLARQVGETFCRKGYVVVNGLAEGCDQSAIEGAVMCGGKVIAVMPCGLDVIYPKSAVKYISTILSGGGCIVSEYPCGFKPQKYTFVERDRIQAALSQKVFVIAAEEKGGTMQTVDYAMRLGRPVGCYADMTASGNAMLIEKKQSERVDDMAGIARFADAPVYTQLSLFV